MAGAFVHSFENEYPVNTEQQSWKKFADRLLIGEVVDEAAAVIQELEHFRQLPERNQKLLIEMAGFMITKTNHFMGTARGRNFWGLYVVGSRARGDAKPDSDLDLLSAGTFYRDLGFMDRYGRYDDGETILKDFEVERPSELPDEYNIGDVNRKYLVRATPKIKDTLPVDISVVDLTFTDDSLDHFKNVLDVDEWGHPLPRVPLVELTVPERPYKLPTGFANRG